MIDIKIDSKQYQQDTIIKDLHLSLERDEITAVVGPSGAGKTTLLNIISGLDTAFDGSICFDSLADSHLNTAYMFQEPRLLPWLSVIDNVTLVDDAKSDTRTRAEQLLTMVGLKDYMHVYPKQLSGGMQRRAALARTFFPRPALVLMDEPFISLDFPSAEALRLEFLSMWKESNSSVLYITHDLAEAIAIADKILFFSPSPANVILEVPIKNKRPGSSSCESVQLLQQQLLEQYPYLLNGRIDP